MTAPSRAERADRLADYFEVQLRLARRMAEITGAPLGEMALRHTNVRRWLGLGVWRDADGPAPGWAPYAAALEALNGLAAQVVLTVEAYRWAPDEILPHPGQFSFGCFAYEPPNEGVVRIHFYNRDTDAEGGPLAHAKLGSRRAELARLSAHIARDAAPDTTIRGGSWLYHVEAYRRLFPPAYADSRQPYTRPIHLRGTATWGQVIDAHERIRPGVRDAIVANLPQLNAEAPYLAFPLQMLAVEAPLSAFLEFYGLGP